VADPTLHASVDYYAGLLITQYRGLPRASATTAILSKQAVGDMLINSVASAFNLRTAVGAQLDIIGKYVGITRYQQASVSSQPWWGYIRYAGGGNPIGYRRYAGGANTTGLWLRYSYSSQPNTAISDASYAALILLKIMVNQSHAQMNDVQQYIYNWFPGLITVQDNLNSSLTYAVSNSIPLTTTVLQSVLPRPMGMSISVTRF
jgi:hypothetical protein